MNILLIKDLDLEENVFSNAKYLNKVKFSEINHT